MPCTLHRWFVGSAVLVALASAGLEAEGLVRSQMARRSLNAELKQATHSARDADERRLFGDLKSGHVRQGRDATTARLLEANAEAKPSARAWHLASLALTWDGERERRAALAASRAARLAPGDRALEAAEEQAVDALTWAEIREVSRPASVVAGGVLVLGLLGWIGRRARARNRRAWIDGLRARVVAAADGQPAPAGGDLVVGTEARGVAFDIFLDGAAPIPARNGPTLSVVLSHGRHSRTVRLTPVKDVRQDAIRVRLSDASLAEVLAHPGHWRVSVALDGRHVGEAGLLVAVRQTAPASR